jgi:hypothetical protein
MPTRLLMIGLDGADGRLLDAGTRDGTLPHLTKLRGRGQGWPLSAPRASTDDSLWASFHYGVGLGEHGRYSYWLEDADGRRQFAPERETDWTTFWDRLSEAGDRIAVIDLPKCRPPLPLNGIQLNDWLTHGRYSLSPVSFPEGLAAEVVARFGPAPPSVCGYAYESPIDDEALVSTRSHLLRSVGQKRDAGLHFLAQDNWDLFAIGFKEGHCSAHTFWDLADPSHPQYDPERVERLGNPVRDVLQALDDAVGALISAAGDEAEVIAFTTTGYVPNGTAMHLIEPIAARIDAFVSASEVGPTATWLRRMLRRRARYCRSVFYSDTPNALLVPRRPDDTDDRYRQRLELVAELVGELATAEDGEPLVSKLSYPARENPGQRADALPQILLHYPPGVCPTAVVSPRLGRITGRLPIYRTGAHGPSGFAIAAGRWADTAARDVPTMTQFAALAETVLRAN